MWLAANKLTLHKTKTEFLLIGSKQRLLHFTANPIAAINQFPIKQVLTVKSLGVHIDENRTWECHINELSKKIASGINTIKCGRYSVPYKTVLTIYNSLVQPRLEYCSSVWGSCSESLSQISYKSCKIELHASKRFQIKSKLKNCHFNIVVLCKFLFCFYTGLPCKAGFIIIVVFVI